MEANECQIVRINIEDFVFSGCYMSRPQILCKMLKTLCRRRKGSYLVYQLQSMQSRVWMSHSSVWTSLWRRRSHIIIRIMTIAFILLQTDKPKAQTNGCCQANNQDNNKTVPRSRGSNSRQGQRSLCLGIGASGLCLNRPTIFLEWCRHGWDYSDDHHH